MADVPQRWVGMGAEALAARFQSAAGVTVAAQVVLAPVLADLRAQVEALPHEDWCPQGRECCSECGDDCQCLRGAVLAILDGGSDE